MNNIIDLHMHSYYSDDGEFSPTELVHKCKEQGIKVMAITDHNCIRSNSEAQQAAKSAGIIYIPSIEIDCTFQDVNLHVLGYGIDYQSLDFDLIEKNIEEQSRKASYHMLLATQELGFQVSENEMQKLAEKNYWKNSWTGEMFAEVLLNKPEYNDHPLLLPYRSGGERGDNPYVNFYWDYYSLRKPCYVKINYPSLEQVITIIHDNCGQAVLAHPGVNLHRHMELLQPIIQTGIDGIEVFTSYHTPEESIYYYNEAKNNKLFITCGSDYHGKTKPAISLGKHGCSIPEDMLQSQLFKNKKLLNTFPCVKTY